MTTAGNPCQRKAEAGGTHAPQASSCRAKPGTFG
jgi:hypothetical protein